MQFPKIVAIIEGAMERAFINKNFHYAHAMTVFNGKSWTPAAMAKQILTLAETINYEHDLLIVWFDREGRTETAEEISATIESTLIASGFLAEKLCVIVCDRMTENLFLLDPELMANEGLAEEAMPDSLGQNGKSIVKGLFAEQQRRYSELHDGVRMLKGLCLENCFEQVPVMQDFVAKLPDCWWGTQR